MMNISIPYYSDLSRISNSNIGWFLNKGPAYLHKMLTNPPPEEKNSTLERGTMIHEYILQPEEFQKDYVVWDKSRPSSAQQEKFCQELAESPEIEPNKALLSAYKKVYSTSGKSDEKMLSESLKIASTLKEYIDFIKSHDERKIISLYDAKMLNRIKSNIDSHKLARTLISSKDNDSVQLEHEFHINWDYTLNDNSTIKCKSLLDCVSIDYDNKIVNIIDLKTTVKLWHFKDSMDGYDYWRQLAFYQRAVDWYLKNEKGIESTEKWHYFFYIIGIDTAEDNEIRVFEIDWPQLYDSWVKIDKALNDIAWHQKNNKWDHSKEYYTGNGTELLFEP